PNRRPETASRLLLYLDNRAQPRPEIKPRVLRIRTAEDEHAAVARQVGTLLAHALHAEPDAEDRSPVRLQIREPGAGATTWFVQLEAHAIRKRQRRALENDVPIGDVSCGKYHRVARPLCRCRRNAE